MAQRLMVARAIMHRPAILFLDEPTSGLDPQSRLALYEIVKELNANGQTVLLTTHYMEEADQLCERLAIIDHGKVLALDTPEASSARSAPTPSSPSAAEGDLHELAERARARRCRRRARSIVEEHGPPPAPRHRRASCPRWSTPPRAAGSSSPTCQVAEPTLETVFIDLTGKELRD